MMSDKVSGALCCLARELTIQAAFYDAYNAVYVDFKSIMLINDV